MAPRKVSAPAPPPPEPVGPTDEELKEMREKEAGIQRRAKGRQSTMLTGGLGVTGQANILKNKLGS